MKKQRLAHALSYLMQFGFAFLLMTGCKSEGEKDDITPDNTGEFFSQCKTGNHIFYSNIGNTTLLERDHNGKPKYVFALVMVPNNNYLQQLTIIIGLDSFSGKGKYVLGNANTEVQYIERSAGGQNYKSTKINGTMEVTDYQPNKYITGVFAIKSTNGTYDLELTEGKFRVEADF